MDGAFACPECGSSVEVGGLAPAAKSGASFATGCSKSPSCPAPPMPRGNAVGSRDRSGSTGRGPLWRSLRLAILAAGAFQFVNTTIPFRPAAIDQPSPRLIPGQRGRRPPRPGLDRSRHRDSRSPEKPAPSYLARLDDWRKKRADLALRDAQNALDRLRSTPPQSFSARELAQPDRPRRPRSDLSSLRTSIDQQFQVVLESSKSTSSSRPRAATSSRASVLASLTHCDRIAALIEHLSTDDSSTVRKETEGTCHPSLYPRMES